MKKQKAFTLIELLIVVAIIAILAAIAVPNFLEAQTRAKISRCKNDLRVWPPAWSLIMSIRTSILFMAWGGGYPNAAEIVCITSGG